jgi:hypothetical protein
LFAAGAFIRPAAVWQGYLVAFNFWLGIALGSLVVLWVHCLTSGNWGNVIRRMLEASASTMPLLAIGFVPILFGLHDLYPWMNPEIVAQEPSIQHKIAYLNESFFTVRAAIYFAMWIALAVLTVRWSQAEDRAADKQSARRLRLLAGPGLVLYGLTITFASVDWVMSLQPRWYSTIFPVVFAIGQVLGAMAFSIIAWIALSWPKSASQPKAESPKAEGSVQEPANSEASSRLQDLANMMLTFVMFWAYVAFSQFLLIWAGNMPDETRWYLPRIQGGWLYVAILLAGFQFAAPFLLLLSRDIKRNPRALAAVALLVLAMHLVDLMWQILPAFPPAEITGHWLDLLTAICATLGFGGFWIAAVLRRLKKMPPVLLPEAVFRTLQHHA